MLLCIRNIDIYVDIHYEILHTEKASMQIVIWSRDAAWSITKSNILKGITMHNIMGFILLTKMCYAYTLTVLYIKCLYMYCTAVWAIVMNIDKPWLSEESQLTSHLYIMIAFVRLASKELYGWHVYYYTVYRQWTC